MRKIDKIQKHNFNYIKSSYAQKSVNTVKSYTTDAH